MIFTIHVKPEALGDARSVTAVAIPETKAKWALLFPPIWLIWHKLYFEVALYSMIGVTVLILLFTPYAMAAIAVAGLPALSLYLEGNQIRRNALDRTGYKMVNVIDAPDEEMALAKHFDGEPVASQPVMPTSPQPKSIRRDEDLSFGLFGDTGA